MYCNVSRTRHNELVASVDGRCSSVECGVVDDVGVCVGVGKAGRGAPRTDDSRPTADG